MWHIGASSARLCLEMCSDKNFLRLGMLYGSDVAGFPTKGGRENIGGGGAHCRNSSQIKTEWGNKTRTDRGTRGFNKFCLSFIAK